MTIKLIACDLDGTLLAGDKNISGTNILFVKKAMEKGVFFCIATGRMFCSAVQFADVLGLDGPLLAYNGALIKDIGKDEVLRAMPLDKAAAQEILLYCREKDLYIQKYLSDRLYVKSATETAKAYSSKIRVPFVEEGEAFFSLSGAPSKLMLIVKEELRDEIMAELKAKFAQKVFITTSNPRFIEIVRPDVNKGEALTWLASKMGIKMDEVMAIGDSYNDMEMLQQAGVSVATENAEPGIKEMCSFVTATNDEDGVAKAIDRYIL